MTHGKHVCKILKDIRKRIAEENDIEYITSECKYKGDCKGTCPKCETELKYLEEQLNARRNAGKTVVLTALCASMALFSAGCTNVNNASQYTTDATSAIGKTDDQAIYNEDGSLKPSSKDTALITSNYFAGGEPFYPPIKIATNLSDAIASVIESMED